MRKRQNEYRPANERPIRTTTWVELRPTTHVPKEEICVCGHTKEEHYAEKRTCHRCRKLYEANHISLSVVCNEYRPATAEKKLVCVHCGLRIRKTKNVLYATGYEHISYTADCNIAEPPDEKKPEAKSDDIVLDALGKVEGVELDEFNPWELNVLNKLDGLDLCLLNNVAEDNRNDLLHNLADICFRIKWNKRKEIIEETKRELFRELDEVVLSAKGIEPLMLLGDFTHYKELKNKHIVEGG